MDCSVSFVSGGTIRRSAISEKNKLENQNQHWNNAIKMKNEMKNPGVSFMTIDKCKFRKPVTPGDVLHLKVKKLNKVKNVYKFEGQCLVNDAIYAQCIFSAMIHDIPSSS